MVEIAFHAQQAQATIFTCYVNLYFSLCFLRLKVGRTERRKHERLQVEDSAVFYTILFLTALKLLAEFVNTLN